MRRMIVGAFLTAVAVFWMYHARGGFAMGGEWLILPGFICLDGAIDALAVGLSDLVQYMREKTL